MTGTNDTLVPVESIAQCILVLRGQKVILDADLARLYGTTTKRLIEQVKRNIQRFPEDFMFQVTAEEKSELVAKCDQFVNLKHSSVAPRAFTEYGALMAANVLNSERAVEVSVYVIRAFVRMREILSTHVEVLQKFRELEDRLGTHDEQIGALIEAIRMLMAPPEAPQRRIGFRTGEMQQSGELGA